MVGGVAFDGSGLGGTKHRPDYSPRIDLADQMLDEWLAWQPDHSSLATLS
jgi:hypothetical protein